MTAGLDGMHVLHPMALDGRGHTAVGDGERYVRGLVEHVLFTRPGERVNRPDFGSGVDALVFAPSSDELAQATRSLVHGALQRFLGELIRVEEVVVDAAEAALSVTVVYALLAAPAGDPAVAVTVSSGGGGS
jgi:uncharacterized protein